MSLSKFISVLLCVLLCFSSSALAEERSHDDGDYLDLEFLYDELGIADGLDLYLKAGAIYAACGDDVREADDGEVQTEGASYPLTCGKASVEGCAPVTDPAQLTTAITNACNTATANARGLRQCPAENGDCAKCTGVDPITFGKGTCKLKTGSTPTGPSRTPCSAPTIQTDENGGNPLVCVTKEVEGCKYRCK